MEKIEKNIPEEATLVPKGNTEKPKREKNSFLGLSLGILSAFLLSTANTLARYARLLRGSEITFICYVLTFCCISVVLLVKRENMLGPKEHRKTNMIRAVVICFAMTSMKFSVQLINPADSTALFHTNVIIVALLSRLIFKELIGFIHILALAMAIIGNNIFPNHLTHFYVSPKKKEFS